MDKSFDPQPQWELIRDLWNQLEGIRARAEKRVP
jgi:hypothetical protein